MTYENTYLYFNPLLHEYIAPQVKAISNKIVAFKTPL